MVCVKCGKKTNENQVFCQHCLEVMEDYPVKPDVHVQLPSHPVTVAPKKQSRKRRAPNAEEQVVLLRGKIRKQRILILLLSLAVMASAAAMFIVIKKTNVDILKSLSTFVEPRL